MTVSVALSFRTRSKPSGSNERLTGNRPSDAAFRAGYGAAVPGRTRGLFV
jgi:hypothetical protein